jgi:hypothetical protein
MINKIKLKPKNQLKKLIDQGLLLKKKKTGEFAGSWIKVKSSRVS